jgi:hypothetical protein
MSTLNSLLSNFAGLPSWIKTGLTGKYDVKYQIELPPLWQVGTVVAAPSKN